MEPDTETLGDAIRGWSVAMTTMAQAKNAAEGSPGRGTMLAFRAATFGVESALDRLVRLTRAALEEERANIAEWLIDLPEAS